MGRARSRQRLGRPPAMNAEQIRQARAMLTRPDESVSSIVRLLGVSRSTLYKHLLELGKASSTTRSDQHRVSGAVSDNVRRGNLWVVTLQNGGIRPRNPMAVRKCEVPACLRCAAGGEPVRPADSRLPGPELRADSHHCYRCSSRPARRTAHALAPGRSVQRGQY
ncbi:helix-turn-helix domain-containing protein [Nocardia jiangxiensis]|uniref:helix-turn-helix domain-containing protein n=1 Tax=Nocardia jiangxiensis TaxID=282685 RepID=UPI0035714819